MIMKYIYIFTDFRKCYSQECEFVISSVAWLTAVMLPFVRIFSLTYFCGKKGLPDENNNKLGGCV